VELGILHLAQGTHGNPYQIKSITTYEDHVCRCRLGLECLNSLNTYFLRVVRSNYYHQRVSVYVLLAAGINLRKRDLSHFWLRVRTYIHSKKNRLKALADWALAFWQELPCPSKTIPVLLAGYLADMH